MKKTIILDCDGVLYPLSQLSTRDIINAVGHVISHWRIDEKRAADISKTCKENGWLGYFNYTYFLMGRQNMAFRVFCKDVVDTIDYSQIKPNPELLQVLKELSKKADLVVCSNNVQIHIDMVFWQLFRSIPDSLGIKSYDIVSTLHGDVFYPKQSEQGLLMFCERLGKKPEECILIDDSPHNIDRAKQIGMSSIHVTQNVDIVDILKNLSI